LEKQQQQQQQQQQVIALVVAKQTSAKSTATIVCLFVPNECMAFVLIVSHDCLLPSNFITCMSISVYELLGVHLIRGVVLNYGKYVAK